MKVRFLLDTNICIYLMKGKFEGVQARFAALQATAIGISMITFGELCFGAQKSQQPEKAAKALRELTQILRVLALDETVAKHYGEIRALLEAQGQPIGANDLWIAAHARAEKLTLVSNNLREFSRVPGLMLENWVQ